MNRFMARAGAALACVILAGATLAAQTRDDLDAPIVKGSSITYRSLVAGVFKDLREDPKSGDLITGSKTAFRRISDDERTVLPAGTRIASFSAIRVRGDKGRYLILMCDAETDATEVPGGGAAVLGLFAEGSARSLDTAEVKTDMLCFFEENPLLSLGSDDAFLVVNHHFNSNQSYVDTSLFRVQDGRLRAIDSVLTLSVSGLCEKSFQETLAWRTEKDGDSLYPRIVATVTLTHGPGENESPECLERKIKPRRETFTETYRWDKAKRGFISDGRGFKGLDRFNRDNFEAGAGPRAVTTKGGICSS